MQPWEEPEHFSSGESLCDVTKEAELSVVRGTRSTGRGPTTFLAPPREGLCRGGPEVRAQGRVPEVKGPCWWVTRGEVPGERRIPRSGTARSPRVSEVAGDWGSPIRLSGPRPASPNQPGATV